MPFAARAHAHYTCITANIQLWDVIGSSTRAVPARLIKEPRASIRVARPTVSIGLLRRAGLISLGVSLQQDSTAVHTTVIPPTVP